MSPCNWSSRWPTAHNWNILKDLSKTPTKSKSKFHRILRINISKHLVLYNFTFIQVGTKPSKPSIKLLYYRHNSGKLSEKPIASYTMWPVCRIRHSILEVHFRSNSSGGSGSVVLYSSSIWHFEINAYHTISLNQNKVWPVYGKEINEHIYAYKCHP